MVARGWFRKKTSRTAVSGGDRLVQMAGDFARDGYTILRGAFTPDEVGVLRQVIESCDRMTQQFAAVQKKYLDGSYPSFETIAVWNDTSGDDIFAKFTRSSKIVDLLEVIFDDEVYVYHNKVALKYPVMPGFKYHQDYFYWYNMGCLYPDLATCYIAIDSADRRNGCLKLVRGSHRLGRINHVMLDGISDSCVDPERLEAILARLPEDYIEMEPGDAVIFHANTLHGSDENRSDRSRLALLGCYNTKHNDPFVRNHDHPNFVRQTKIDQPVTAADASRLPDFNRHFREEV